ncbi:beta strand repeat-containing protein [Limnovirga soli]|uniref:Trimeric autotransporter adhesin YadA-like head domain-containing protein n=1 Tax=Limnovirga soli TaxID=2656915 RepID=A0A8J8FJC4_9BACT|nr:hypothetical protein [Limnovirga soli]NNV57389.1 hypothetical protein [Limnovirga soli]
MPKTLKTSINPATALHSSFTCVALLCVRLSSSLKASTKALATLLLAFAITNAASAQVTYIYGDTTKIKARGTGNNELQIFNATRSVEGFLYNTGGGLTKFKPAIDTAIALNDSTVRFSRGSAYFDITIHSTIGGTSTSGWSITGNAGTTAGTNFIGTTDAQSLYFKVNNVVSGWLDAIGTNTSFGVDALTSIGSAGANTAIGHEVLHNNSTGIQNTGLGYQALMATTSGDYNTALGSYALTGITTATHNTAVGVFSLSSLSTGAAYANNTGIGYNAGYGMISSDYGTYLGYKATGSNDLNSATAIGAYAKAEQSNSLILGSVNGKNGATQTVRVGIGTTQPSTTLHLVGDLRIQTGGEASGKVLTSDADGNANWNYPNAGWSLEGNAGTNPSTNFLGTTDAQSLLFKANSILAGQIDLDHTNTSFGYQSLLNNTSGTSNVAFGDQSLKSNSSGTDNVAIGHATLYSNTTVNGNVGIGSQTLFNNVTGTGLTAIGAYSLLNSLGNNNIAIGQSALPTVVNSTGNIAIGNNTDVVSDVITDAILIGHGAKAGVSNSIILGDTGTVKKVGIGTGYPSANFHVKGSLRFATGNEAAGKVLTSDVDGNADWADAPSGTNIYNSDGTLTGNRILDGDSHNLTMQNLDAITLKSATDLLLHSGNTDIGNPDDATYSGSLNIKTQYLGISSANFEMTALEAGDYDGSLPKARLQFSPSAYGYGSDADIYLGPRYASQDIAFTQDYPFTWTDVAAKNITELLINDAGTASGGHFLSGYDEDARGYEPSALLHLNATDKGFLIPRMTTAQRDAISSPANALMIYNTTTEAFEYYTGLTWTAIGSTTETEPLFTASDAAGISSSDITNWNGKLNISDTSSMLSPYARTTSVAIKLSISDTSSMLSPYERAAHATATFAVKPSGSSILKANGSGGFTNATAGTDYVSPSSTETLTNKSISGSANTLSNIPESAITQYTKTHYGTSFNTTNTIGASTTNYLAIQASGATNATENNRLWVVPESGTLRNLYVAIASTQPASGSLVFTIRKGTVGSLTDQSFTLTIAAGSTAGVYSNTSSTLSVTAGDILSYKIVNNATATSAGIVVTSIILTN